MYLARDRDGSLHLFGTGSPPFFDIGMSQVSLEDSFAPYYGEIGQSDLNGIHIEPETVIPVVLALPPANPATP